MPRIQLRSQWMFKAARAGMTRRAMPMLVRGVALVAGALAPGAQAPCTGHCAEYWAA